MFLDFLIAEFAEVTKLGCP